MTDAPNTTRQEMGGPAAPKAPPPYDPVGKSPVSDPSIWDEKSETPTDKPRSPSKPSPHNERDEQDGPPSGDKIRRE